MTRNLALKFICLIFSLNFLNAFDPYEYKCQTSTKYKTIANLDRQKAKNPMLTSAIEACKATVNNTYNACVETVKSSMAAANSTSQANTAGYAKEFNDQKGVAGATSELNQKDAASNQVCAHKASEAEALCSGFPGSESANAYAADVKNKCITDGMQANKNKEATDQLEEADKQLTPPQSPSPTASNPSPPPNNTPANGYTPTGTTIDPTKTADFVPPTIPTMDKPPVSPNPKENEDRKGYASNTGVPSFAAAYQDLTGKEPSLDEITSFVQPAGASNNGSSGVGLSASGGDADSSGNNSTNTEDEEGTGLNSGGSAYAGNSGGGLSYSSFKPNSFDIGSGPGLTAPGKNNSNTVMGTTSKAGLGTLAGKSKPAAKTLASKSLIPGKFGKRSFRKGALSSSGIMENALSSEEGEESKTPVLSFLLLALSAVGFAYRKFYLA